MKRYAPGQHVEPGFYLNTRTLGMTAIGPRGGALPGPEGTWCLRVPALVLLLLAPLLGALYVVYLPLAGFALLFGHMGRWAAEALRSLARRPLPHEAPGRGGRRQA